MPFDEEDEIEDTRPRGGVKPPKSKSIFDNKPKPPSKEDSERRATAANNQLNSYNNRAFELAMAFKKALEDKTLPQNRTVIGVELEKELLGNLGQLAVDMNTDEHEVEGMGSVGLISLLLRCLLLQRDRMNTQEYSIHNLEGSVKNLQLSLEKLLAPVDAKKQSE